MSCSAVCISTDYMLVKASISFFRAETEFLGLQTGLLGVKIGDHQIPVAADWPCLENISELRSSVELLQFFKKFIKYFVKMAASLTNLIRNRKEIQKWNNDYQRAIGNMKSSLTFSPIMIPTDRTRLRRCHVDASKWAVGDIVTEMDYWGRNRAIVYFSKRLGSAEENYSANNKERFGPVYFL